MLTKCGPLASSSSWTMYEIYNLQTNRPDPFTQAVERLMHLDPEIQSLQIPQL